MDTSLKCSVCATSHRLDKDAIPPQGRLVQCRNCTKPYFLDPDNPSLDHPISQEISLYIQYRRHLSRLNEIVFDVSRLIQFEKALLSQGRTILLASELDIQNFIDSCPSDERDQSKGYNTTLYEFYNILTDEKVLKKHPLKTIDSTQFEEDEKILSPALTLFTQHLLQSRSASAIRYDVRRVQAFEVFLQNKKVDVEKVSMVQIDQFMQLIGVRFKPDQVIGFDLTLRHFFEVMVDKGFISTTPYPQKTTSQEAESLDFCAEIGGQKQPPDSFIFRFRHAFFYVALSLVVALWGAVIYKKVLSHQKNDLLLEARTVLSRDLAPSSKSSLSPKKSSRSGNSLSQKELYPVENRLSQKEPPIEDRLLQELSPRLPQKEPPIEDRLSQKELPSLLEPTLSLQDKLDQKVASPISFSKDRLSQTLSFSKDGLAKKVDVPPIKDDSIQTHPFSGSLSDTLSFPKDRLSEDSSSTGEGLLDTRGDSDLDMLFGKSGYQAQEKPNTVTIPQESSMPTTSEKVDIRFVDGKLVYDSGQQGEIDKKGCVEGDCQNGVGTFIYNDGSQYIGPWKNGKKEGEGAFTFGNGSGYKGVWKGGKIVKMY